jgi:hypothetical protein
MYNLKIIVKINLIEITIIIIIDQNLNQTKIDIKHILNQK